jgi:DNA-binding beta-propeller fold protein YncE
MTRRRLLASALGAAGCSRRTGGVGGFAFIANQDGRAVAVVDMATLALVRHIHLDANPSLVLTGPARPSVYAVTPRTGTLHEINPDTLTVERRSRVGADPSLVRLQPDGAALWALCSGNRQLVRVPVDSLQPAHRFGLPAPAVDFDFGPDGPASGLCAISFGGSGRAALLRLDTGRIAHTFELGSTLGKLRFRNDGRTLMAAELTENRLAIVDVARRRLAVRLALPLRPEQFRFKGDLGQLFLSGQGMDAVVTVYTYQTEVGATMLAGRAPGFLAVSTRPDYLFVANPTTDNVTILNIDSQRVIAVASVGKEPCHITVTPDNEYALVLNRQSGDMAVLHVGTLAARRTRSVPILTMVPVGSEPVSAVVRAV